MNNTNKVKLVIAVREDSECDDNSGLSYIVLSLDAQLLGRIEKLSKIAQSEAAKISISTAVFEDFECTTEMECAIEIFATGDVDLGVSRRVKNAWPITIENAARLNVMVLKDVLKMAAERVEPVALALNTEQMSFIMVDLADMGDDPCDYIEQHIEGLEDLSGSLEDYLGHVKAKYDGAAMVCQP